MRLWTTYAAAALLCILCCRVQQAEAVIKVDPATQMLVDETGRVRLFHGVNAVFKIPPWLPVVDVFDPANSITTEDIKNLKEWGFNAVRLGVMWPGVEPVKGQYNITYLQTALKLVQNLASAGIYTIVDMHQDLISRFFCGEGLPDWAFSPPFAALPFPEPSVPYIPVDNTTGYPPLDACLKNPFFKYYLSGAVGTGFQRLYTNQSGLITSFQGFWSVVSKVFANEDSVLGYELLNEPWPGDVYKDPSLLKPGVSDKKHLEPLYSALHTAIRSVDDEHIIFFERALTDLAGATGLTQGPGGPAYNDRQVYSYHIYCAPTDRSGNPTNVIACDGEDTLEYGTMLSDLRRLKYGGFMTEFGAYPNATKSLEALRFLVGLADSNIQSWTYWQFKYFADLTTSGSGESFYDPSGNLQQDKVKELSRTYPYATAGVPQSVKFDPLSSRFEFTYVINTSVSAPTEIYLNEAWYYPNGYTVALVPSTSATWTSPAKNNVVITHGQKVPNGSTLSVFISPK